MTALRTLIKDVRVLGQRQRTLLLLVQQAAWTSCSFGFLPSKPHRGSAALLSATLSVYLSCITDEEPQVWEPQSFIMGCKKTFLLLQKEVLFLSSKAICYLNIYEKTVQNKAASASHKTCRNSRNAWHLPFIPYIKKCPQSYTNSKWIYSTLAVRDFLHAFLVQIL